MEANSDHLLMRAKFKVILAINIYQTESERKKYNRQTMRIAEAYEAELRKKIPGMDNVQQKSVEEVWTKCKEIFKESAEQTIELKKRK